MKYVAFLALTVSLQGANLVPAKWEKWSPRPEIAPQFAVAVSPSGNVLTIRSRRFAEYGKWIAAIQDVRPGSSYRFDVEYRAHNVAKEEVSIAAMLSWFADAEGTKQVQRDYVDRLEARGEWRRMQRTMRAPEKTRSLRVELIFRWSNNGSVEWRAPQLVQVEAPASRLVRVATTHIRPAYPTSIDANVKMMQSVIDEAGAARADIVCLSEGFAERAVPGDLNEKAHPIPGPVTAKLAESARKNRIWVVTALVEREGDEIYNTAVLIDREGRVAGKYRKVHLPTAEAEDGMTPGSEYPVFDTDFGRIALIVCWDNWFPEPARIFRLKGAEMLLFPLAGDEEAHWDLISRARAVDNGLYVISSNTVGGASRIIDPSGEVLAQTSGEPRLVSAQIDLNREWRTKWLSIGPGLGEGKSLYVHERRPDTYGAVAGIQQ